MAVESAADRLSFLSADDFGVTAVFGSTSVAGIFDREYEALVFTGEAAVASRSPRFVCREADLGSLGRQGQQLTVGSDQFRVREVKPDGTGMVVLELELMP